MQDVLEAVEEHALLQLATWACRRLGAWVAAGAGSSVAPNAAIKATSPRASPQVRSLALSAASATDSAALTVLRYLVDYARQRSLSLLRLVTETHDAVGLSGHLLLLDGPSPGSDPAAPEIQAWLLLRSALMDDGVRARIDLAEDSCRARFRALAERLSPRVIAAVPVLRDLHAFLIEAAAWQTGPASGVSAVDARPLIEVVIDAEESKQATLDEAAWAGVRALAYQIVTHAARQLVTPAGKPVLARLLATLEVGWQVAEQGAGQDSSASDSSEAVRVEIYRQGSLPGQWHCWSSLRYVQSTPKAEPIETAKGLRGVRHSLAIDPHDGGSLSPDTNRRALPCRGKLCILVRGRPDLHAEFELTGSESRWVYWAGLERRSKNACPLSCGHVDHPLHAQSRAWNESQEPRQASRDVSRLFTHPCLHPYSCRDTSALPATVWLTAGSLLQNGMAFQLQLTRIDQPMARDASSGLWLPYQPSQAAITFLKQPSELD